jgi:1-acyl-sn-glycerol-3-phosphate acyltransferase
VAQQPTDARKPDPAAETAGCILDEVRALAAELRPHHAPAGGVGLDSSLDKDLGLDSLARMELLARLEHAFDVALSEHLMASAETPRDLVRAVLGAGAREGAAAAPDVSVIEVGVAEAVPRSARTLIEVLDWHVRAHPQRPHVHLYADEGEGETVTYRALWDGAERVAAGLRERELEAGEAVIIMLPTGRDYFFSFFGVLLAGGVPVAIYPPARPTQVEQHLRRHAGIVRNCLARVLITVAEAKPVARLLGAQAGGLRHAVTVEELSSAPQAGAPAPAGPGDVAFLQYTSGSTGDPKGVVLTHANLLTNIRTMADAIDAGPDDVFVSWLPLYHDMGLNAWLSSLLYAMPLVLMSPLSFLARPQRWLRAIHRYRGTLSAGPNFAYELCLRRIPDGDLEGLDLSSWRIAFNGAEAVSPVTIERFSRRFAACGLRASAMTPVYGLAECSVGLAFPPMGRGPLIDHIDREALMVSGRAVPVPEADAEARRVVACGLPLPGHQIRIVDAASRELPERHEGRLQFKGPSATSGYFRNADATRRLFDGEWLESGDLAYIAAGEVYITGRSKDVIIRAGRNVYPDELEEAVGGIAGIRKGNVAVFGSADPDTGTERLIVLAETRERDAAARQEMRAQVTALATDITGSPPDEVVLAPLRTVPKTSSGKIRRTASREVYETGAIGRARGPQSLLVARLAVTGALPGLRRVARVASAGAFGAYWWCWFGLVVPVTWLVVGLLPRASWRWTVTRTAAKALLRGLRAPLDVQGLENLPPSGRACIYVCNHASYLDSCVLLAALPRVFAFVAKAELRRQFITRVFLRRIGAEFVERFDREQGAADAQRLAGRTLPGRSLMFFAEGTCQRMPGLLPFHMGAFQAAVEAGVPVVPITIRGTRTVLRPDTWLPRRGKITVVVDPPIEPNPQGERTDSGAWAEALRLRNAARARILSRSGEPDLEHERVEI